MALAFVALLAGPAVAQTYEVPWYTFDGGGEMYSSGDGYVLGGTIGQADAGRHSGDGYVLTGGFWAFAATSPSGGGPLPAVYPDNRQRNRYIAFDPNKAENDGSNVAFKVTLTALSLGSCDAGGSPNVEGWPCRTDDDCRACSVQYCTGDGTTPCSADADCTGNGICGENARCWTAPLHCAPGDTCDLTGAVCLNDHTLDIDPVVGQHSVGRSWWIGPQHPTTGVHLMVSQAYRKVSAAWPDPVTVADCEIVPAATYTVVAVDAASASESDPLVVSTSAKPGTNHWADCVGALGDFCTANWASCTGPGDCPPGETCIEQWPPPDGFISFHDVTAAVFTFSQQPGLTVTDIANLDLHGNEAGDATIDPPNYVINFVDIADMISAFQGYPYKYSDPGDCPAGVGAWP